MQSRFLAFIRCNLTKQRNISHRWFVTSHGVGNIHFNVRQFLEPRYVVHFGNLLAVCAMMSSEMLYLRCFMIGASVCGITFNLLQPIPLITPACWGVFFIIGHSIQVYFLIRDKLPVTMSDDLKQVYKEAFSPYGFTPRQFMDLCESADYSFIRFNKDEDITTEGADMPYMYWLMEGKMVGKSKSWGDFAIYDTETDKNETRWTGEFFDPNRDETYWDREHKWGGTHQCLSDCYALRLDRRKVDVFLNKKDTFKEKASKIMVKDLWNKLRNVRRRSYIMGTYKGMLDIAVLARDHSEVSDEIQDSLEIYAKSNNIHEKDIETYLRECTQNDTK